MPVQISSHFQQRQPSPIRQAQILFAQRPDRSSIQVVNVAIGNVSRPMHPAMQERMRNLGDRASPFADGVVKYSASAGTDETQRAFLNVIASAGCSTDGLAAVVTDGASLAMELMVLGVCGPQSERPLMVLDPAYTNYMDMARRVGVHTVSIRRHLSEDGVFSRPDVAELARAAEAHRPAALVVIPADNPTGQFLSQADLVEIARVCVKHDMWLVSDEAYRQLQYQADQVSSVWSLSERDVPGITGLRISIESASKVWNACGLRVGALVTDNPELHAKAVAEHTANLCSNVIGQYIFGALAHASHDELNRWYTEQRTYYAQLMREVRSGLEHEIPGIIVSEPAASIYSVVDVRRVCPESFDAARFVRFCAQHGSVPIEGAPHTLLVAPMGGFYGAGETDPWARKQMRLAFVEPPDQMQKVPKLFAALLEEFAPG